LSEEIIVEVSQRTPGFNSWQQEIWLACCNDACEFHGDLPVGELQALDIEELSKAFGGSRISTSQFENFKRHYRPGGNPALYKWVCRHCGMIHHQADFT
jgi:uncharacterized protein CbrC (UPF0167 family)